MFEESISDFEKAKELQDLMIRHSTGEVACDHEYQALRRYFIDLQEVRDVLPQIVRNNRDLSQFWQYIKFEFSKYAERRNFIYSEFASLLEFLELKKSSPADGSISTGLRDFSEDGVHSIWSRALERRATDPEGAITSARTLLETVCKHILDEQGVSYDAKKIELHDLYKKTATELKLSPSQHEEDVFKQILGGCSAVVSGLGTLRNRLGDAHGKGKVPIKPAPRHAEFAVNLAGSVALFLVSTWQARQR